MAPHPPALKYYLWARPMTRSFVRQGRPFFLGCKRRLSDANDLARRLLGAKCDLTPRYSKPVPAHPSDPYDWRRITIIASQRPSKEISSIGSSSARHRSMSRMRRPCSIRCEGRDWTMAQPPQESKS
ncbi:MAG: hypothetical protein WC483_00185 [Candidatus Paceibacterota bacterium]